VRHLKHVSVGHDDATTDAEDAVAAVVLRAEPVPAFVLVALTNKGAELLEGEEQLVGRG